MHLQSCAQLWHFALIKSAKNRQMHNHAVISLSRQTLLPWLEEASRLLLEAGANQIAEQLSRVKVLG